MLRKGFTLIELLIAITILAVISTAGVYSYSKALSLTRDHKRKEDLKQIEVALQLYYQKNGAYPGVAQNEFNSLSAQPWIPNLVPTYIENLPVDPINKTPSFYLYIVGNFGSPFPSCPTNPPYYMLIAPLENANDKDSLAKNPSTTWCDGVTRLLDLGFPSDRMYIYHRN